MNFPLMNAKTAVEKSIRLTQVASFFAEEQEQLEKFDVAYRKLYEAYEELEKAGGLEL